jgi:hypothetical protein
MRTRIYFAGYEVITEVAMKILSSVIKGRVDRSKPTDIVEEGKKPG